MQSSARKLTLSLLTLAGPMLFCTCAKDRPLNPQIKESVIYAGGSYFTDSSNSTLKSLLYILDTDSLYRQDSILLDASSQRMSASRDGSKLYVQSSGSVLTVDAASRNVISTLPNALLLTVLYPDNRILARIAPEYTARIVDVDDGSIVHNFDQRYTFFESKTFGEEVVAWFDSGDDRALIVVNTQSMMTRGAYRPRLRTGDRLDVRFAVLHPDGRRVLSIGRRSSNSDSWFVVGDIDSDSTLLDHALIYSRGEIAVSDDGRWAAVTDPSSVFHDSARNLSIFDMTAMRLIRRFVEPEVKHPDQVRFLPGSSIIAVYPTPFDEGPLQIVSVEDAAVVATRWLPSGDSIRTQGGFLTGALHATIAPKAL